MRVISCSVLPHFIREKRARDARCVCATPPQDYFNRRFEANSPPTYAPSFPRGFLLLASLLRIKRNFDKVAATSLQCAFGIFGAI